MSFPLVSIICPAYNHEKFIAETLNGFITQKTTFTFEIIVHDDASTDNTAGIIKEYEAKFPNLFANIYQIENQFSKSGDNIMRITFAAAKGKYIAHCEGDDYWCDENKLQKQVDFLESNKDYSMCFHKVKIIVNELEDCGDIYEINNAFPATTTTKDLARRNYIPSVSVVYRSFKGILPKWFHSLPMGDWPLFLLVSKDGKIGFIDEFMAVYRKHASGVWSSVNYADNHMKMMRTRRILDNAFSKQYHKQFFHPEDMDKNNEILMEYYRANKRLIPYYRSLINMLFNKKNDKYSWGRYYLLFTRYFSKN